LGARYAFAIARLRRVAQRRLRALRLRTGATLNALFDHEIPGSADHDQMFGVVAAQKNQAPALVEGDCLKHRETGHTAAARAAHGAIGEPAEDPCDEENQNQHDRECDHGSHRHAEVGPQQLFQIFHGFRPALMLGCEKININRQKMPGLWLTNH
jgi:hypothetical protein